MRKPLSEPKRDWYSSFKEKIEAMTQVQDAWDGQDALKPEKVTLDAANRFMAILIREDLQPAGVDLSTNGYVVFRFVRENMRVVIEIDEDGEGILYFRKPDSETDIKVFVLNDSGAEEMINLVKSIFS